MDTLRSLWREKKSDKSWSFYCPQCKVPRRVPYRPQPSVRHYLQIGLTAVVFTLLTWNWFHWKGVVSFLPLWILFEIIYRTKLRAALNCECCGFDPVLYRVDVKRARREIEDHWKKKFEQKGIPFPPPASGKEGTKKSPDPIARS